MGSFIAQRTAGVTKGMLDAHNGLQMHKNVLKTKDTVLMIKAQFVLPPTLIFN